MSKTLFVRATLVTVDATDRIILDGALLVDGNRIRDLGKTQDLIQRHSGNATRVIDLSGRIVIPGLINAHAHLAQSLIRGLAEDVSLHTWLCDSVWPLEASYEGTDGAVAARLTMAEMLKSGTTCFLEALLPAQADVDAICETIDELGIRSCLGKLVKVQDMNSKTILADARDKSLDSMSIESALGIHAKYNRAFNDRLHIWMAAVTPRGSDPDCHGQIGRVCREKDIGLTMHCAEAPKDLEIYRECYGCSPMEFCREAQVASSRTVLAHMVNLDLDKDLPILRETNTSVAHNPSSNCKLASGIASVPEMLKAGVNVCLGTDGAPCSNNYDMLQECRMASLLQKGRLRDAGVMTAQQVLRMATINGARALGLENDIGSLEIGKKADFAVVSPSALSATPFDPEQLADGGIDPVTTVVFSCTGADVEMVVVDGAILVEDKCLKVLDEEDLKHDARTAIRGIRDRSRIKSTVHLQCNYV
ncbi:5-methylthioadenosine/S-adenosylhomocysteine deaminase [Xylariales sp. PMI_506]|nr:5-methylthioadenosine/S-adenosylhomocysteine deaminase [Xylariales sp. PMI_506]